MKTSTLVLCLCLAGTAPLTLAENSTQGSSAGHATADPVNTMCPIGKEPAVPSAGTVEYKGKVIGMCCPGCGEEFLGWDEARKDEFVALAVAHREPGTQAHAGDNMGHQAMAWTGPYTLNTCPVSGGKLGSMGDPIVKKYDGREVRLCCAGCIGKFEADQPGYWQKIDEQIIADQMSSYPMDTCIVSGEKLTEKGKDTAINVVYGNRLVRLCCKGCERKLNADPVKFIHKLDEATAEAQRADYPLDTCVVSGGKLGSMGDPVELVIAGRLVRLCCAGCLPKVEADPAEYVEIIDKARGSGALPAPGSEDANGHGGRAPLPERPRDPAGGREGPPPGSA